MTWCYGRRLSESVILIADSAITIEGPLQAAESTFGENHIHDSVKNWTVEEGRLKIFRVDGFAITFAGDVESGERFIDSLRASIGSRAIAERVSIDRAIAQAVFPGDKNISILVGWWNDGPHLLHIEANCGLVSTDLPESIHIGSIPPDYQRLTSGFADRTDEKRISGARWLMPPLSIMQSFVLHHTLLEHGAGGAFSGCCICDDGFHWQPDILYVVHDDTIDSARSIGVFFVDDVMTVTSGISRYTRSLLNPRHDESAEIRQQRRKRAYYQAIERYDSALFDFAVFLNYQQHIVTIVEMRRQREHAVLVLIPEPEVEEGRIGIHWAPELVYKTTTIPQKETNVPPHDICLQWIPFRPFVGEMPAKPHDAS